MVVYVVTFDNTTDGFDYCDPTNNMFPNRIESGLELIPRRPTQNSAGYLKLLVILHHHINPAKHTQELYDFVYSLGELGF